jgi:DNA-binding transcriptional ArsR family regulator
MARKRPSGKKKTDSGKEKPKATAPRAEKPAKRPSEDFVNHDLMKASTHPLRAQILAILAERVASPNEMAEELGEGLSQVAYHVKVLREYRLVEEDHKLPRRGAVEHFYRATSATMVPPDAWGNLPSAIRKGISACILREFFDDASASMEAGVFDDPPGELCWTPLLLGKSNGKKAERAISATVFVASFLSARSPKEGRKASAAKRR